MKSLIIGTGFLGEQLYLDFITKSREVLTTYHHHQKYSDSVRFDFFKDSPEETFERKEIDTVILPAKIEFTEDSDLLQGKMEKFTKWIGDKRFIYISSDGIFDGEEGNYTETDTVHPVTLYGKNLKICEDIIRKGVKNYCIIRPNYLYGFVNGKLDSRLQKVKDDALAGNGIVRFDDMYKSPLSYRQASEYILRIAYSGFIGTVHISGPRMSVYEFTLQGMKSLGLPLLTLRRESIPKDRPSDFLVDTSLDAHLAEQITGIQSLSVEESFKKFYIDQLV